MKAPWLIIQVEVTIIEKIKNAFHLKNKGQINLIFHVDILGKYAHVSTKYESSMIKPVARKTVHRRQCQVTTATHDGQSMIVQALRHLCQMSQQEHLCMWSLCNGHNYS